MENMEIETQIKISRTLTYALAAVATLSAGGVLGAWGQSKATTSLRLFKEAENLLQPRTQTRFTQPPFPEGPQ